ncbi:alkaline shock response membrane anchor protein AmaP, partial [Aerococcus sp. L_32]
PEDTKVKVVFQVDDAANVIDLASRVQERVRDTVAVSLGIPVADVNVKVNQIDRSVVVAEKQAKQKAVPRVQ